MNNEIKLITTKQLYKYHWQSRSGTIYDNQTGKRIYTDFISALHDKLLQHRKLGTSQLISYRNKIDGYIYFEIGNKKYKTPALLD